MNSRFRVSGLLASRLEEQQVSLPAVLHRAGLPAGFFQQEKIFVTTEELFAMWTAIAETSSDPAIGLKLGSESRIERYDPAAIAALHSQSLRDALQRMARYKQLTCPEQIRVVCRDGECTVEFVWLLAEDAEPAVIVDLCLSWILSIGRRGIGGALTPLRVELARDPGHRELLETHYGCRVKFKAARNALTFRESDLDRPFVTHNAEMLAVLGPQLDAELRAHQSRQTVHEQVKISLKRMLAGQRPSIQEIARALGLSSRTLQRRLTESGITFQRVLEESRRELAAHYLGHSGLELNEIAYLLGYDDPNSFFRAFHDWEGTTPGQWRSSRRTDDEARLVAV
ncbi:AraC family transcriptional regulator [Verrucomicrobiota bacterium sgz303538]